MVGILIDLDWCKSTTAVSAAQSITHNMHPLPNTAGVALTNIPPATLPTQYELDTIKLSLSLRKSTEEWEDAFVEMMNNNNYPVHVVREIIESAAPHQLKISDGAKQAIFAAALKTKNSVLAQYLFWTFHMRRTINVKSWHANYFWGDLSAFDPKLCKNLIEWLQLGHNTFSGIGAVLKIKDLSVLRWVIDRFCWTRDRFCGKNIQIYKAVREHLLCQTPKKFEEFMVILLDIVDEETFSTHYIVHNFAAAKTGDDHDAQCRNLLHDCLEADRMEQFDFLVQQFNVQPVNFANPDRQLYY